MIRKPIRALDANIVQDNAPVEVLDRIFIGSIHAAFNQESLVDCGVSHILNASRLPCTFPKTFTYLTVDLRDKENANILSCIPSANIFIEAGIEAGGVFVHCFGGRSRSAAFITAYLMSSRSCSYEAAYAIVHGARPLIAINKGFEMQLRAYGEANYDVYEAEQKLLQGRIRILRHLHNSNAFVNGLGIEAKQEKSTLADPPKRPIGLIVPSPKGSSSPVTADTRNQLQINVAATHAPSASIASGGDDTEDMEVDGDNEDEYGSESKSKGQESSSPSGNSECNGSKGERGRRGKGQKLSPFALQLRKHIPLVDARAPNCRLSRPNSQTIRVIPPLRGLESCYCCSWCGQALFNLASVVRPRALSEVADDAVDGTDSLSVADSKTSSSESFPGTQRLDLTNLSVGSENRVLEQDDGGNTLTSMGPPTPRLSGASQSAGQKAHMPTYVAPPQSTRHRQAQVKGGFDFDFSAPSGASAEKAALPEIAEAKLDLPPSRRKGPRGPGFSMKLNLSDTGSSSESSELPRISARGASTDPLVYDVSDSTVTGGSKHCADVRVQALHLGPSVAREQGLQSDNLTQVTGVASDSKAISTGRNGDTVHSTSGESAVALHSSGNAATVGPQGHLSPPAAMVDESPRIPVPAHRVDDPRSLGRPQTAEKRRWLARLSLLSNHQTQSNVVSGSSRRPSVEGDIQRSESDSSQSQSLAQQQAVYGDKLSKLVREDEDALRTTFGVAKYFHLEYLEWMGFDMLLPGNDSGELRCDGCKNTLGNWYWKPTERQSLGGLLQSPVIRVPKNVVHEAAMVLDNTPTPTPRNT